MKYSVLYSLFAKEDKKEIKAYLSRFYPETPRRFTASLKKHITNLKDNPYMYPIYFENTEIRRMIVDNYVVFFEIFETEKKIELYRILRASWDLPTYL